MSWQAVAAASFGHFAHAIRPAYIYKPFHYDLMRAIQRTAMSPGGRLFIGMPPRHGKSDLCSILLPAWYLGRRPSSRIMHLSYSSELTNSFSLQVRRMVRDDLTYGSVFKVPLGERQRVDDWNTAAGGGFRSVGVGGGITGHGADLMIIDDPHKEGDHLSLTILDQVYDWYTTAARTRLSPGASIVFVMTRWAVLDLAGRLLALEGGDEWQEFVLPAIAGANDAYGRAWPERYPVSELEKIRANDERHFQALYQNDPRSADDVLFHEKYFVWVDDSDLPVDFWSFDLASSLRETADFTVMCAWSRNGDNLTLLRVERGRWAFPEVRQRILALSREYPEARLLFPADLLEMVMMTELRAADGDIRLISVPMKGDKR